MAIKPGIIRAGDVVQIVHEPPHEDVTFGWNSTMTLYCGTTQVIDRVSHSGHPDFETLYFRSADRNLTKWSWSPEMIAAIITQNYNARKEEK